MDYETITNASKDLALDNYYITCSILSISTAKYCYVQFTVTSRQSHLLLDQSTIGTLVVLWAFHFEEMRNTSHNMQSAAGNTRLSKCPPVFVQQNEARNILYVIMEKLNCKQKEVDQAGKLIISNMTYMDYSKGNTKERKLKSFPT